MIINKINRVKYEDVMSEREDKRMFISVQTYDRIPRQEQSDQCRPDATFDFPPNLMCRIGMHRVCPCAALPHPKIIIRL